MNRIIIAAPLIVALAAWFTAMIAARPAQAADPKVTTIVVKDMHCSNCASKIARKLYTVPGVVKVTTNVKANTAVVTPQATKAPSPRAMWDAVEQAGFAPVRMQGPSGTFTSKPKT
jgi:Cu+-exporting ATPase